MQLIIVWKNLNGYKLVLVTVLTKPWREIIDPAGATISQVKRYVKCSHLLLKVKRKVKMERNLS